MKVIAPPTNWYYQKLSNKKSKYSALATTTGLLRRTALTTRGTRTLTTAI